MNCRPLFRIQATPPALRGKGTGSKNEKARIPRTAKPIGVMTYAEMSAEIASLFFKNTVLAAEVQRLTREKIQLSHRARFAEDTVAKITTHYENKLAKSTAEFERVSRFADGLVNTI